MPVVAVAAIARVDAASIEARVGCIARPVRTSRAGPQATPVTLVAEALPPEAGEDPLKLAGVMPVLVITSAAAGRGAGGGWVIHLGVEHGEFTSIAASW